MYKIFTASDFVYELKKNIFKCNHSVQLFITEFDLLALSNEIIELLPTERTIDIVISSVNQKKSLGMVNLFNRIVQSGGTVYWNENHDLYQNATLTTVGYGDVFPITGGGKLFASVVVYVGLGLVALPAGLIGGAFSEAFSKDK